MQTLVVVSLVVLTGVALAQSDTTSTTSIAGEAETADHSPRTSVVRFIDLCRGGNYDDAAEYLDLSANQKARGAVLARRLKAVLDRHAWLDVESISPLPGGNPEDGLARDTDEIAKITGRGGSSDPVRLVRSRGDERRWVFTRATVNRIDGWYGQLKFRWLLDRIPAPLMRPGPGELLYWQWLALPVLVILAWALGGGLSRITRFILRRLARRTRAEWDDAVLARIGGPLTLAWGLVAAFALLPWLGLYQPAEDVAHRVLRGLFLLTIFWALVRMIDVARQVIAVSPWALAHPGVRSLLPLLARVAKALTAIIGVVTLFSELGFPVASLVAGLGIGGLALALAAQKTVENLFGAFAIGADQPFREGDFVSVEDFVGTVETIGLRSTRIRTLDRTVISIPNGRLADMRLESLTERDRMRLHCTVGLVYGTTAGQMRTVLEGLERVLRSHSRIWPDAVVVRFKEFGDSSLNIEIMAWFQTREFSEFQLMRQDVLLQFMEVVEQAGSSFAFPTRTVHLVTEPPSSTSQA